MNSPIRDFVKEYKKSAIRFHMPGHKGKNFLGIEKYDITEVDGADVLYQSKGIIKESQNNASALFGSGKTVYSAEGSSLCIRAMVHLVKIYAKALGKEPVVLSGRNAHKTFVNATALLGVKVEWMYAGDETVLSCKLTPDEIENKILASNPVAVYITSPDYLGNISDIREISRVCKKHGVLLMVDNAHGAYLKFLPESLHPLDSGADICCDSAHKTLPVLTGGAYLHIGKNAPDIIKTHAENSMSLYASTSPSYLILQSLDMTNCEMDKNIKKKISFVLSMTESLKSKLIKHGFTLAGDEPLKITIAPKSYGYTGFELEKELTKRKIIPEFCDRDFVVLMLSSATEKKHIKHLEKVLLSIEKRKSVDEKSPHLTPAELAMCPYEAITSPFEETDIHLCEGKILARASASCPPAVSIVTCGEKINKNHIECFEYYGIEKVYTIKK